MGKILTERKLAAQTQNADVKAELRDMVKKEKTHICEFQALLLNADQEQVRELDHGKKKPKS